MHIRMNVVSYTSHTVDQRNVLFRRNNVPPRPAGQRSEPETNVGFSGFGFGDGSYMSYGIGTFPFAFFTSTFNFGETRPSAGNILYCNET